LGADIGITSAYNFHTTCALSTLLFTSRDDPARSHGFRRSRCGIFRRHL
jgi:hypothetical protein